MSPALVTRPALPGICPPDDKTGLAVPRENVLCDGDWLMVFVFVTLPRLVRFFMGSVGGYPVNESVGVVRVDGILDKLLGVPCGVPCGVPVWVSFCASIRAVNVPGTKTFPSCSVSAEPWHIGMRVDCDS